MMGTVSLKKPHRRSCERCNRSEAWDSNLYSWRIVSENGEKQIGNIHCIHEWDITGTHNPIEYE